MELLPAGEESFFQRKGLEGIYGFEKRFSRLSAAVVIPGAIRAGEEPRGRHLVWANSRGPSLDRRLLDFLREM
jgi:hypothetical protein